MITKFAVFLLAMYIIVLFVSFGVFGIFCIMFYITGSYEWRELGRRVIKFILFITLKKF